MFIISTSIESIILSYILPNKISPEIHDALKNRVRAIEIRVQMIETKIDSSPSLYPTIPVAPSAFTE